MKRLALLLLCTIIAAQAQGRQKLTLSDAIRIGQENSRILKLSSSRAGAASARSREVATSLYPSVKFDAGYRRLSDVPPFEVNLPIFPQPIVLNPTVLNNYTVHLGVQQPLFTGFRLLSNARAADYLARASAFENENDRGDLILSIIGAYWTFFQAQETKRFIDENVLRLKSYEADTKNLVNAGLATRNDLLRVQVQLDNARLSQIDAANDLQLAMLNLNNVMGQPLSNEVELVSSPDTGGVSHPELHDLISQALAHRADLQAMALRIEASKASLTAARGGYLPQLFLSGNYYYNRPNSRYLPAIDEFKSTWDIGVTLQFDVWNWGATSAQADQAEAAVEQNRLLYDQAKENISLDVQRSILAIGRAQEKVSVARLAIEQALENVRSLQDKYHAGLATSTELLDANVALLQAKTNYTGSLVEAAIAQARLDRAIGEK